MGRGKSTNLFYGTVPRNPDFAQLFAKSKPEPFLETFYEFFEEPLNRQAKDMFLGRNAEGKPQQYKVIFTGHYVEEGELVITGEIHHRTQNNQSPYIDEHHLNVSELLALDWHEEPGFQELCRERF